MTPPDYNDEAGERTSIQAAIGRLLHGQPLHSTGELTVVQLAAEAGVKRWRLTHQHTDLMHTFQAAARQQRQESPLVTPWRERVEQLEADRAKLRSENADLRATVETYAQVIDDLNRAVDQLAGTPHNAANIRRIRLLQAHTHPCQRKQHHRQQQGHLRENNVAYVGYKNPT